MGTLFVVATPIGNLNDISSRALQTLREVDLIACEDTRHTIKLLNHFGIQKPMTSYHDFNEQQKAEELANKLAGAATIALVSDAGTPLISDPGFKLVREVCAAGHAVIAVPGASSVLTALSVAALPTDRFFFEGFLPAKEFSRRTRLAELARIDATLVMFESGNRVQDTLADLADIMGGRDAAICRELTKLHEDIKRAPIAELAKAADTLETRGEFVLVVGPPRADEGVMTQHDLDDLLRASLSHDSVKDSVAHAVPRARTPHATWAGRREPLPFP